jgi:hypothetical protein
MVNRAGRRQLDFWRVNSYGYPCYFIQDAKAQQAWTTLVSFYEFKRYTDLKKFWDSSKAPRRLNSHAVESWKATFEEVGLLYVLSGSNEITITPAGQQFRDAADKNDKDEFAWIGLSLLFRYPLRGPRRPKSKAHEDADLLLYRFLYAAMRDLNDYFWWTELERILCTVFHTAEAEKAVADVKLLRADPTLVKAFPLPAPKRKGGFYNSLNQVAVHASMNHLLLRQDNDSEHYGGAEIKRRHLIDKDWLVPINAALGGYATSPACGGNTAFVVRLPTAPYFSDEQSYFEYVGSKVPPISSTMTATPIKKLEISGQTVFVLPSRSYKSISTTEIQGAAASLCALAKGHRVILSHVLNWTYRVQGKELIGHDRVRVTLRQARPITDREPILQLLGDTDGSD